MEFFRNLKLKVDLQKELWHVEIRRCVGMKKCIHVEESKLDECGRRR
jgi:hypothetical protein